MRRSALLFVTALALAGCPEKTQESLPPAGLAGAPGASPHANPHGAAGMGGMGGMPGAAGAHGAGGATAGAGMGGAAGMAGAPGMAGAAAMGAAGMAGAAGAASQPAASHGAAPHPPMGTVQPGAGQPAAASQPATATVIPGGGAQAAAGAAELSGVVTEAHHVKEYTYLRVKADNGSESWAAVLKDESIGVGTKIALGKDVWMSDFQSPSLGKSFDRILFGRVMSKQ